ncbi:MAG: hypothetical protein U0835_26195 [Isosphaeraceae bacterium]
MLRADFDSLLCAANTLTHPEPVDDFAERLERHIERCVCGRVCDLQVARCGENLVLRGRCRTYHAKQLVLQAALDMVDGMMGGLVNQIVVA